MTTDCAQDALGAAPGREAVLAAIERALAGEEFAIREPSSVEESWMELQREWRELWTGFVEQLASALGGNETAAKGVVVLLVLGVVALAAYVARRVLQARGFDEPGAARARALPAVGVSRAPGDELARANELARAGRYAEAMHGLYRGVLLWLDELGQARFDEGKTGGEYARELRSSDLRPPFRTLLSSFYPVAFGGRTGGDAAWRAMRAAASSMGVPE